MSANRTPALITSVFLTFGASLAHAAVAPGEGDDCDRNGIADSRQLVGDEDCNKNGIPDECDIANGTSQDCNSDGIPDECLACPPLDVVFVMDTSGSMSDEGAALCSSIGSVVTELEGLGIEVNASFLGITSTGFGCLTDTVRNLLGPAVPGNPSPGHENLNSSEDWGPATAVVADRFPWIPGSLRVIVPISDEGPENGNTCDTPEDEQSILNAIDLAVSNGVIVSPISGTGSSQCVIDFASQLAIGTGGVNFLSTAPNSDLAEAIHNLILDACANAFDCNKNGIPDECDPDNNGNGIPDDCEEGGVVELDCAEFDRYEDLTANDTLTLLTSAHNPQLEQGYLCVVAVDSANQPIGFDKLIGHSMSIDAFSSIEYSINALDYLAAVAPGALTDVDDDGILDLNGIEYEKTAGEILIPRFMGQTPDSTGELLLISLAGGRKFTTTLDFLIYNDNEVGFSAEHHFYCWDRVPLTAISNVFANEFLAQFTGDNPNESLGGLESGWMRIDGGVAVSTATSINDPAFYAVYIERLSGAAGADLPFERCVQSGHLLPNAVHGDNEEPSAPDQDCGESIRRRNPGSFLLFPEFDNRTGLITITTVTNTDEAEGVRAHYIYVGRYGI